jgi:hypothetical protein
MRPKKHNGLTAGISQPAEQAQETNDLNLATGKRHGKAESSLCAAMAQAGHTVHILKAGGYLVMKYGRVYEANSFAGLQDIAKFQRVSHG